MRLLVPFVEFVICLLIFKWLIYGYRRKSELTVVFASMLLLFGLFVLASEILIDGFYRELRAGRIDYSAFSDPNTISAEELKPQ